jgi:M3 family oligoendopeptidase
MPFVFVNYNATFDEVVTFAHECGHALQSYIKRGEPFLDNTNPSFDLCEIHSMAMEFFIWPYLKDLIPEADIDKYKYLHLKSALSFIPYGTIVDAYQTEVYDHPEKTPAQRREMWQSLEREFLPWKKFDGDGFYAQGRFWQRQTHIYRWPFYYIDYVLAQTCALQYHFMDQEDHEKAWNSYLTLVRESDRCSFSETLEKAGLESPFKPGVLAELGRKAVAELDALAKKAYK